MKTSRYREIVYGLRRLCRLAAAEGIDLFAHPARVREMVVADAFGHQLQTSRRKPGDATDSQGRVIDYKVTTFEKKRKHRWQFGPVIVLPERELQAGKKRIAKRFGDIDVILFALFSDDGDPLNLVEVVEVLPDVLLKEIERQIADARKGTARVNLSVGARWIDDNLEAKTARKIL